jgi:hypothetical protein
MKLLAKMKRMLVLMDQFCLPASYSLERLQVQLKNDFQMKECNHCPSLSLLITTTVKTGIYTFSFCC